MFVLDQDRYHLVDFNIDNIQNKLPNGIYMVEIGKNIHFKPVKLSNLPKLLGSNSNRILDKIVKNKSNTLLVGESGFGKTLIMKYAMKELSKSNVVLFFQNRIETDTLSMLLNHLEDVVLCFDEFEKNYIYMGDGIESFEKEDFNISQESILQLLDGITNKHTFIFTANNKEKISKHMLNRPGRIRYVFTFNSLEDDVLESFNFSDKELKYIKSINATLNLSIDMLKTIKEELDKGYNLEETLLDLGIPLDFIKLDSDYVLKSIVYNNRVEYNLLHTIKNKNNMVLEIKEKETKYTDPITDTIYLYYENDVPPLKNNPKIVTIQKSGYVLTYERKNDA